MSKSIRQCKLVIVKRTRSGLVYGEKKEVVDYFSDGTRGKMQFVTYKSDAELFNKRDAEKDLLPLLQADAEAQMKEADPQHAPLITQFELVELVEKKLHGHLIVQDYPSGNPMYMGPPRLEYDEKDGRRYSWFNSPYNGEVLETDFKDAILAKLKDCWPESKFRVIDLFTE